MQRRKPVKLLVLVALLAVFIIGSAYQLCAAPKKKIGIISLYLAAAVPPRIADETKMLCDREGWQPIVVDTKADKQRLIGTCLTWVQQRVDAINEEYLRGQRCFSESILHPRLSGHEGKLPSKRQVLQS